MKSDGEIMEILAAYDLTGSLRATAELTRVAQVIKVLERLPSSGSGRLQEWGTNGSLLGCPRISGR